MHLYYKNLVIEAKSIQYIECVNYTPICTVMSDWEMFEYLYIKNIRKVGSRTDCPPVTKQLCCRARHMMVQNMYSLWRVLFLMVSKLHPNHATF